MIYKIKFIGKVIGVTWKSVNEIVTVEETGSVKLWDITKKTYISLCGNKEGAKLMAISSEYIVTSFD